MGLGLNINLGIGRQGGGGESQTDIAIPQLASVVRCWSTRRNIPAYALGNAIQIERDDDAPAGLPDDDVNTITFEKNGTIAISAGDDAYIYQLYDQKGSANNPKQSTYANCPLIFESGAQLPAPAFGSIGGSSRSLAMGPPPDSVIQSAVEGYADPGFSYALWFRTTDRTSAGVIAERRHITAGWCRFEVASNSAYFRFRIGNQRLIGALTNNTWTHLAFTVFGTEARAFFNGTYVDKYDVSGTVSAGAALFTLGSGIARHNINDVAMWNKALSDDDVLALFNATCGYYGVGAK